MKYLLCRLGVHDWLYNSEIIKEGTVRVCRRKGCSEEQEYYIMGDFDRTAFWRKIK